MMQENTTQYYLKLYSKLLGLYPRSYRERYAQSMLQTFRDLLFERTFESHAITGYVLWTFVETSFFIVKLNLENLLMHNKSIVRLLLSVGVLLMIPLVAMQFTNEVVWTFSDFVVAGMLLLGAGLSFIFIARRFTGLIGRSAVALAVISTLFLIWANLAVGLIGNESEPINLLYIGVVAIGIVGSLLARFKPEGMSRTLVAMSGAVVLIAISALSLGLQHHAESSALQILGVNGFFTALFALSAILFRLSSRTPARAA